MGTDSQIQRTARWLPEGRTFAGLGEQCEGIEKSSRQFKKKHAFQADHVGYYHKLEVI